MPSTPPCQLLCPMGKGFQSSTKVAVQLACCTVEQPWPTAAVSVITGHLPGLIDNFLPSSPLIVMTPLQ